MGKIFESPMSFVYHTGKDIVVNGVNIIDDIVKALEDYDKGDWLNTGKDIGEALALLILGEGLEEVLYEPSSEVLQKEDLFLY